MPILNYNQGLEDAAALLEHTAQDYDQMSAKQREFAARCNNYLTRTPHAARAAMYADEAQLLRGQAGHIRKLRK